MSFSLITLNSVVFSFFFFFLNVSSEHQQAGKRGGVGLEGAAGREGGGGPCRFGGCFGGEALSGLRGLHMS